MWRLMRKRRTVWDPVRRRVLMGCYIYVHPITPHYPNDWFLALQPSEKYSCLIPSWSGGIRGTVRGWTVGQHVEWSILRHGAWFITKFISFALTQYSLTVQNRGLKHHSFNLSHHVYIYSANYAAISAMTCSTLLRTLPYTDALAHFVSAVFNYSVLMRGHEQCPVARVLIQLPNGCKIPWHLINQIVEFIDIKDIAKGMVHLISPAPNWEYR